MDGDASAILLGAAKSASIDLPWRRSLSLAGAGRTVSPKSIPGDGDDPFKLSLFPLSPFPLARRNGGTEFDGTLVFPLLHLLGPLPSADFDALARRSGFGAITINQVHRGGCRLRCRSLLARVLFHGGKSGEVKSGLRSAGAALLSFGSVSTPGVARIGSDQGFPFLRGDGGPASPARSPLKDHILERVLLRFGDCIDHIL
jgi:hypothetical protein